MFGRARPVVFESYGRRRSRRAPPRWLVLMLVGAGLGVGGVLYVQERHLPPRLSAGESAEVRSQFERAEAERRRLEQSLTETTQQLERTLADRTRLAGEVGKQTQAVKQLREDLESLVAALPPDPRNGAIAVRAARFAVEDGALAYDVVLSRERAGSTPVGGVLQFVVAGSSERGADGTVALKPVPISVGSYDSVRGSQPLPDGFKPKQTTIQVLDKVGGRLLGMRVMHVK